MVAPTLKHYKIKKRNCSNEQFRFYFNKPYESKLLYELNDAHLSSIATAYACLDDAAVTAVSAFVCGGNLVKKLLNNVLFGNVCQCSSS